MINISFLEYGEYQCWALPQIRKWRTQGFSLRICEPISYRKDLQICGKKIEIYRKSTTSLGSFLHFQKNTFLRFNISTDLGECIYKVQNPLTKFLCCEMIIFLGCCCSCTKMSWLNVKKLPTACFSEGKLRLFEVVKGCTRRPR